VLRRVQDGNRRAYEQFRPQPYPGSAVFIRVSGRDPHLCDPIRIWTRVVRGGLTVVPVHGGHFDVLEEPNVAAVAGHVDTLLARAG
jgi:thioesterase domain-containing protein